MCTVYPLLLTDLISNNSSNKMGTMQLSQNNKSQMQNGLRINL